MKTARDKVCDVLDSHNVITWTALVSDLVKLIKEQDKITRHACADNIAECAKQRAYGTGGRLIDSVKAEAVCINTKAV